jgi:phospholipid/cholesterol/gamma-HCH transport system substrate-binding protein
MVAEEAELDNAANPALDFRPMRFRIRFADQIVGIFILLAILGVAAALILLGLNQRWFARNYAFWTRFASAEGLTVGMPIKLKGFEIGKVDRISLGKDNVVEMEFHVYDTYYPKMVQGSVMEKATSALGLGSGLVLHPGEGGGEAMPEYSLVPSTDFEEGRRLLAVRREPAAPQSDPIAGLITQVQPVLEEIDLTVVSIRQLTDTMNRDLQGRGAGPLSSTLKDVAAAAHDVAGTASRVNAIAARLEAIAANLEQLSAGLRDPTGLAKRLLDPKGSLDTLLDDDNRLYNQIAASLEQLQSVIAQLAEFTRFVNSAQPQILGLLEQGRTTLDQGQQVLEAVKNNPLLRGGVPPRPEQQTPFQGFRDQDF